VIGDDRVEQVRAREVDLADRVHHEHEHDVAGRLGELRVEGEVERLGGTPIRGPADLGRDLDQLVRLLLAPTGGRKARDLDPHEPPRLHEVGEGGLVQATGAEEHVGDDVETPLRAPVAHPHRVAVTHLDQPELLEPLDGLAHRRHVHVEVRGEPPLRRQLLPGRVAPREDVLAQPGEDLIGDELTGGGGHDRRDTTELFGTIYGLVRRPSRRCVT
jgi:hypothetical protein